MKATTVSIYRKLGRRINLFPQRAPDSPLLYKILKILFSPEDARLAAMMPLLPFDAAKAARIWKMPPKEAQKHLERMATGGLLLDIVKEDGSRLYVLPPPMVGFFEIALMHIRHDIDQKALATLFYQYLNVEEAFSRDLFLSGPTALGRFLVQEPALPEADLEILDYERASEIIRSAFSISLGLCYCRHKMAHVGRACEAPQSICMTFNHGAASLIRNGLARKIDAIECMDLLQQAYAYNLVQGCENVRQDVSFICNCCACCCEGLIAARTFGTQMPVQPANFFPMIDTQVCNGCGKCERVCPAEAIHTTSKDNGNRPEAVLDATICLGCGICARNCAASAITLQRKKRIPITPKDMLSRTVSMALERGVLQNLIFDNQALLSHRLMAAILGILLKLPPVKQALANRQLQSLYLESIIAWKGGFFPESQPDHIAATNACCQ